MREETRMIRTAAVALCIALTPFFHATATVVNDWNAIGSTVVVANAGRPPGAATIDLVYVNVAMYDAVNAIDGRYGVFAVTPATATAGASQEAAAISAAYNVLKTFFPAQAALLDARNAASLAAIADGDSKSRGILIGQEVATLLLAQRAGDGRNAAISYTPGSGPGVWQPTPPAFAAAQTPWIAYMKPFAMNTASQFRADAPPALDSQTWADDYNETRILGDVSSVTRTPEQTQIGLFYTEHTGGQYNRILRDFAATRSFTVADEARFFAQMYVSIGDALIAVWNSKFSYNRWRPVTAIRAGDTDGNAQTEAVPTWTPLAPTPPHPEYPAAHGAFTGALAEGLRQFFGTKRLTITLSSTVTNTTRAFYSTDDLVSEIIVARIYGGMHFRTSVVQGSVQGKKAAKWAAKHCFTPVDDDHGNHGDADHGDD